MEYHQIQHQPHHHAQGHHHQQQQQQHQYHHHHQSQAYFGSSHAGLALPDSSSSSEKALMWSGTQYMSESGYSTQAPSISSIDAFMNNEQQQQQQQQMDSTMHHMESSASSVVTTSATNSQTIEWNAQQQPAAAAAAPPAAPQQEPAPSQQQQQQQQPQPQQPEPASNDTDTDNAVANWINYQDNSEMALKAIPDLLKLLIDEDLVVVQQAAILLNQMSRMEAPRMGLIQTNNAVQCLVDCLNTTADLETARSLVGALYGVSTQKPQGVQAIINSKALQPLVKMLSAPLETIVSYAITTLHNVLLDCGDKVKMQMRKMGAIHHMVPLLNQNQNVKFLSIVIDCLQLLAFGNQESKQFILELGGTQQLVNLLLNHTQYQKLILNATRLLKVLSVCSQNKAALVSLNAMQALAVHLVNNVNTNSGSSSSSSSASASSSSSSSSTGNDILHNCLITLRNLSDAATRLNGLEQLVTNLLQLLSTSNDYTACTLAVGILSNLTCNNENNKKTVLRANGIQILLKIIQTNLMTQKPQLVEPSLCALRHITNRHSEMLLAQEQVRLFNGLGVITQLMCVKPRSWPCIKAVLGVVRNFCSNQLNSQQLRSHCIIEKLMQILYDAYTEICIKLGSGADPTKVKVEDVNLLDIVDMSASSLLLLAKECHSQIIMKDLDCIGFFVQMFFSPVMNIQKAAASILAELAANKECADVIELSQGLHQHVQANFCNQFGVLKTIAELSGASTGQSNSNASIILQHVTTLMQRLQEHKTQYQAFMMQQQQQAQPRVNHHHHQYAAQPAQQPQASPMGADNGFGGMPMQQHQPTQPANMMYYHNQQPNQQFPPNPQFY